MTVDIFLFLLVACSILTGWLTEALKKFLDSLKIKYASNILVLLVSIVVGGGTVTAFYILNNIITHDNQFVYTLIMIVLNWLGSMVGYDKIIQTIKQFKNAENIEDLNK